MDQATINSYQPGGSAYNNAVNLYGKAGADQIASAALTGDQTQFVNAIEAVRGNGAERTTNTLSIFGNKLATDPFAAPLASANTLVSNSFFSFLKNKWVVAVVVGGLALWIFSAMGGWAWLGSKTFKRK